MKPGAEIETRRYPLHEISGMRNRLIHGYMDVNLEIVWDTVEKILPDFLARIREIQETSF
jgi:uncharacterized protein with HEPN domain